MNIKNYISFDTYIPLYMRSRDICRNTYEIYKIYYNYV